MAGTVSPSRLGRSNDLAADYPNPSGQGGWWKDMQYCGAKQGIMKEVISTMASSQHKYVIVGGALAGASAIEGIRKRDAAGSILLLGRESDLPYDRPPLSKKLWFGTMKPEEALLHDAAFYTAQKVDLALGVEVTGLDAPGKTVADGGGNQHRYDKLLLATGGVPRRLSIPGGDAPGICYYRYLSDYHRIRQEAGDGKSVVVIGGGFIGSELAAALSTNRLDVTMVFQDPYLAARVFPEGLGRAIQESYRSRGVTVLAGDEPVAVEKQGSRFVTRTKNGKRMESDILIVGVGIEPSTGLAQSAGLTLENGIAVNEYLQTSDPNIYAAGDNAFYPCPVLGIKRRIEHWDNARAQGEHAGLNMAGANEPFTYLPFFFSDLFEFGYEAVGDVDARLETFADWQTENETGVIYYLKDGKVRGAMMCNVWDKVDAARELIAKGETVTREGLKGAIC